MISKQDADEKVSGGWLRVWLAFEAMAINEEVVKKSLESLMEKLDLDSRVKIYQKTFGEIRRVEKPLPSIPEGWSQVCDIEIVAKKYDELVQMVVEYGPSAAEILEPKSISLDINNAQGILNSISDMMHRFAAAGIGGAIIVQGKSQV